MELQPLRFVRVFCLVVCAFSLCVRSFSACVCCVRACVRVCILSVRTFCVCVVRTFCVCVRFVLVQVTTAAIVAFFVQDVVDPPPELFLSDLDAYIARTHTAGAFVLLQFLKYVGYPVAAYQWGGRSGGGPIIRKLTCYSFHVFRSLAHKVASVQIALITLFGYCCAFPDIQVHLVGGRVGAGEWVGGWCPRVTTCMHMCRICCSVAARYQC